MERPWAARLHTPALVGAGTRVPPGAATGAFGTAWDDRVLTLPPIGSRAADEPDRPRRSERERCPAERRWRSSRAAPARTGREVARGLAGWGWAIVVVYLEHQRRAEATVAEILAAEGTTVAVRADLADDLDVQRLFAESIAAFGGVDVVVHTTTDSAALLYQHAARHVRRRGAIVSVSAR